MKKILLCSIDAPFIGGAGTNSYNLIKLLRSKLKHQVIGLFIYTDDSHKLDPHGIGNIFRYNAKVDKIEDVQKRLALKFEGGLPDIILAKNYISVLISKKLFPNTKIYFLPSGSQFYSHYCALHKFITATDLIDQLEKGLINVRDIVKYTGNYPCYPKSCPLGCDCEMRAIVISDKIIANSKITERLFRACFGKLQISDKLISNKILSPIEISALYDHDYITKNIKVVEFNNREWDVMFACYSWSRKLKNGELISKLLDHPKMRDKKILVIGGSSNIIKTTNKNVKYIGCVDNKDVIIYLSRTKCYVCPSYYDSFPNMITEADLCGCNIVASPNIGQATRINKELLVNNFFNYEDWITKICSGASKKYNSLLYDQSIILNNFNNIL